MRRMRYYVLALLGVGVIAVPAFGTPGSGATAVDNARGVIGDRVKIREPRNTDFLHQRITIAPGGHTGWHSHPGAVLVTVKTGTLTFIGVSGHGDHDDDDDDDDGNGRTRCVTVVYPAGSSFVDAGHGHVHIARNLGATPVELWATYTGVPPGVPGAQRIDAADPGC